MSLQLSYEASTGVTHASAHHKITNLNLRRQSDCVLIYVTIFKEYLPKWKVSKHDCGYFLEKKK